MLIGRAKVFWIAAAIYGLAISLPLAGMFSSFNPSTNAPHIESSDESAKAAATYVIQQPESWGSPLVVVSGVLCVITLGLACYTRGLFRETAKLARDTREASTKALEASTAHTQTLFNIERAYLAGGGECLRDKGQIRRNEPGERLFRLALGNHGKTPAFLTAYGIHFCTLEEARKGPQPVRRQTHTDQFPPGEL
jgi:hypothetical protein